MIKIRMIIIKKKQVKWERTYLNIGEPSSKAK
jgi:hypothetical protein